MNSWQVGNIKITRVVEMQVTGGSRFILPQAIPETILPMQWLQPHFADEQGKLIMSIHALVIETADYPRKQSQMRSQPSEQKSVVLRTIANA